jgi:hypothetical protein
MVILGVSPVHDMRTRALDGMSKEGTAGYFLLSLSLRVKYG